MHAVQFNERSACHASMFTSCIHDVNVDVSQADRVLNWTARINKNIPSISGLPMVEEVVDLSARSPGVCNLEDLEEKVCKKGEKI